MRIFVFVLAFVALTTQAAADPARDAATHYRQGVAFEKAGALDKAIEEYKQAYGHDRKPSHLFNIARVFDEMGDRRQAITHYDKFLAADPNNPRAKDARAALAVATKKLADEEAAKKQAEDAAAAAAKKLADDKERVRVIVEAHLKQAAELERRGAWASAAEEYVRATLADGNAEHLIAAGEAFRKQPELARAKAAFQQYLDRVPNGPRSDEIRGKVADLAREIDEQAKSEAAAKAKADADKAAAEAKLRAEAAMRPSTVVVTERPRGPRARGRSRGWKIAIAGLGFGAVAGVFTYLSSRTTFDIERGKSATGGDVANKFSNGKIYDYVAIGSAAVALTGLVIGGITIGINLGDDDETSPGRAVAIRIGGAL